MRPGEEQLKNSLIVLASGEVEATATLGGEQATLHLLQPGDLAGIITFAGGNVAQISATVVAKTDCKVLLLERSKFEVAAELATRHCVLRDARHRASCARHRAPHEHRRSVEMSNYIYKTKGRF